MKGLAMRVVLRPASLSGTLRDYRHSPLLVFYELTRACDLACVHCRACAQPGPAHGELSSAHSHDLLEQIADFPTAPLLVFTGGDPFKRPDLTALVHHAARLGLHFAVTPSATPLVTREALAALWHAGVSRIAVSLDGPDAASHDRFRGARGSFHRTLEIIQDARSLGLPVQVNTTITPLNWQRVDAMAALVDRLDIVLWSVFFLVPTGRAASQRRLNADQVEQVFEWLWNESKCRTFAIKTTEAPHYCRFVAQKTAGPDEAQLARRQAYSSAATNDGKGVIFVAHDGAIYPSGFMPIRCGAFPRDNLVQTYQRSPLFQALRDPQRLKGKCGACKFRTLCGGSRARSYAVTGDPLAAEPDCAYLPEGWLPAVEDSQSDSYGSKGRSAGL
jgi:radical SAM protein